MSADVLLPPTLPKKRCSSPTRLQFRQSTLQPYWKFHPQTSFNLAVTTITCASNLSYPVTMDGPPFLLVQCLPPSPDLLPKSRTSSAKQKKDTATSSTLMAPLRLLNCDSLYSKQIANKTNLLTASMLDFFTISRSELLVDRTKDVDAACNGWWRGLLRVSLQDSNKGTAA